MPALWTSAEIATATGGEATRDFTLSGLSIDTRSIKSGDLFIALKDIRDGHDFVADALKKGAAGALVSRIPEGCTPSDPLVIVPDVLAALGDLGRAGRARSRARVIAVTGSVGKTSTKEMLRAVLGAQGHVHAAEASFNNHWGVPITLARMPRDADFAVIEIGMSNPGEIAPLARMARPHAAMITTVAPAHLEAFGSLEGIAAEKAAICEGVEPGGLVVLPDDLPVSGLLFDVARGKGLKTLGFGADPAGDYVLDAVRIEGDVTVATAHRQGAAPFVFKVQSPGRHFAGNALGVIALCAGLGLDPAVVALDIGLWAPPAGRGARERIYMDIVDEGDSFDLFDDAFNANPASMTAGLAVLAGARPRDGVGRVKRGRRVAILGDMLELGPDELALHAAIAADPAMAAIDIVHLAGPRMAALYEALPRAKRGEYYQTAAELAARAAHLADAGDVVLVKGSKGAKVSLVVEALKKRGLPEAADVHKGKE